MSDRSIQAELDAYVRRFGQPSPASALTSWVGRQEGLIIGENHPGVEASLALIEELAGTGRFHYWATEWLYRRTISQIGKLVLSPQILRALGSAAARARWRPVIEARRRLERSGMTTFAIGTTEPEPKYRDSLLFANFADESIAAGVDAKTPGLVHVGIAHAGRRAPFYKGTTTLGQLLNGPRSFQSVLVITSRVAKGESRAFGSTRYRVLGGSGFHNLLKLDQDRPNVAIPLHRGARVPFYDVELADSESGEPIARQFDVLVLIRSW